SCLSLSRELEEKGEAGKEIMGRLVKRIDSTLP
ncbi:MAG: cell division protein ZapA, partial [Deltaproteobacteria bacterium]|nr:cell division protein ZapA [Deltaproteobacteria bacterium]